jgi:hypothetical protein
MVNGEWLVRRNDMHCLRKLIVFMMLLAVTLFSGCRSSGPVYHMREDIDFSYFKNVAVLPMDNLTSDKSAGEIVRQLIISELLASGLVDVVVPGEVSSALNKLSITDVSTMTKKQIMTLGELINVQAVIMGSVDQYGEVRSGNVSAPEVTITLLMADTTSGDIVWSMTNTHGGASFMERHFGTKSKTMSETVLTVVRETIDTLTMYHQ